MEAPRAEILADINPGGHLATEVFQSPTGWLQEELYWEISGTKDRVRPMYAEETHKTQWIYVNDEKGAVNEALYPRIFPRQSIRYFDAAKAQWDFITNKMTAYVVSFCIADIEGHAPQRRLDPTSIIAEGTADSMTFSFTDGHHNMVESSGTKLRMGTSTSLLEAMQQ